MKKCKGKRCLPRRRVRKILSEYERIHNTHRARQFTRIIYIFYSKDDEEFIPPVIVVVVSRVSR